MDFRLQQTQKSATSSKCCKVKLEGSLANIKNHKGTTYNVLSFIFISYWTFHNPSVNQLTIILNNVPVDNQMTFNIKIFSNQQQGFEAHHHQHHTALYCSNTDIQFPVQWKYGKLVVSFGISTFQNEPSWPWRLLF